MPSQTTKKWLGKWALAGLALLLSLTAGGCSSSPDAWPGSWERVLGRKITLEGKAANAKAGALLLSEDGREIWIDGRDEWPAGLAGAGAQARRLRVTGTVIRRDDLPALVAVPGEPERAGIPVASERELEGARIRYLLADASWEVVD